MIVVRETAAGVVIPWLWYNSKILSLWVCLENDSTTLLSDWAEPVVILARWYPDQAADSIEVWYYYEDFGARAWDVGDHGINETLQETDVSRYSKPVPNCPKWGKSE